MKRNGLKCAALCALVVACTLFSGCGATGLKFRPKLTLFEETTSSTLDMTPLIDTLIQREMQNQKQTAKARSWKQLEK